MYRSLSSVTRDDLVQAGINLIDGRRNENDSSLYSYFVGKLGVWTFFPEGEGCVVEAPFGQGLSQKSYKKLISEISGVETVEKRSERILKIVKTEDIFFVKKESLCDFATFVTNHL
jgi:hypothetical protein